jgi:hypothetical protein
MFFFLFVLNFLELNAEYTPLFFIILLCLQFLFEAKWEITQAVTELCRTGSVNKGHFLLFNVKVW